MTLGKLDAQEITTWLARTTQTIDRSLRDPIRTAEATSLLQGIGTRVSLSSLAALALLDDCLRVAHRAIEADGKVETEELARVTDLARVAAARYFSVLPRYESFGDSLQAEDLTRFLRMHRADSGPFGYSSGTEWRGLKLARVVEQHTRNPAPRQEHERMLARVMETVFEGRASDVERRARRQLRDLFEPPVATGKDPRVVAFCRHDGPEVFSSVAHGSQIHERDPFDVESIHAEAREVFHRYLERATTPLHVEAGQGRTLLLLGDSGAGKTHLMRALRALVHGQRFGYVGYSQMSATIDDHVRHVLRSLVDSLERPYDAPSKPESALMYLSDGLVETRVQVSPDDLERLRTADLSASELEALVGSFVDEIVRTDGLGGLEADLLQALLLLQRRDPAVQSRVVKFLRCEHLNNHERDILGGLAPRQRSEDPLRTLVQLGKIMFELQAAALVIVVDQIEDAAPDGAVVKSIQMAFDALRAAADAVPSSVVVISCLDDVYTTVRPRLSRALVDRLENDPAPVRLAPRRQSEEIEQMLARRLDYLYTQFDVDWRDDDPIFPFTREHVEKANGMRSRDALAAFRAFHAACIEAGDIVGANAGTVVSPAEPPKPAGPGIDKAWGEALAAAALPDDDDDAVAKLVAAGVRLAAEELGRELDVEQDDERLVIRAQDLPPRVVGICNAATQRGAFGRQLEALAKRAAGSATAIAVRQGDFQFSKGTKAAAAHAKFIEAGGRTIILADDELRAIAAASSLAAAATPGFLEWRRDRYTTGKLQLVREVLDLDRVAAPTRPASESPTADVSAPPRPSATPAPRTSGPVETFDPTRTKIGATHSVRAEPVYAELEEIKKHVAFLGGSGSGKTTAALAMIEQLLERNVSVLLVDRKGDLAPYADEAWWNDPEAADRDKRSALRKQIDIALYTPGNSQGRPLRLPLVPPLSEVNPQERDRLAKFAADGLATMMEYGGSSRDKAKASVLQCAISLLADREVTLETLYSTISQPDPELLRTVNTLQRYFGPLAEDLDTLRIQRGSLLSGSGEALDMNALLPPASANRPQLSIINTQALGEINIINFWISRLLVELARLARKRPSPTLQAAAFFDEADAYIPATSSPPTKDPMFDLLRRARAAGIGVLLATQNPGDLDYRARDNIATWLVGKVSQDRAIDKMRNLLGPYPNVGPRLASQPPGHFFVLTTRGAAEVRCDRSLMSTTQRSEDEIAILAAKATARASTS